MMSIFEFSDYRAFLRGWIKARPKNGRGELRRMADALNVNPSLLSQALSGSKSLSLEMAAELAEYLSLTDKESDYFLTLVEFERAGSVKLRKHLKARIEAAQKEASRIAGRVHVDRELSNETKSIYYSSWVYTGIRNLVAVKGFGDIAHLSARLQLPKAAVSRAVEFLLEHGLCRMEKGQLTYGPAWTHIPADSPLVVKHHHNWRLRALTKMDDPSEENLFFTGPMSLSAEAAESVRKLLPGWIEKVQKIAGPSTSETVRCLNIDWFEY